METASYMSPEQVRCEKLDARTDLFSFGLVLYEMATGQQAFKGETVAEVRDAILNRAPTPARDLSSEVPPKLEAIIQKAAEKDRNLRYQDAAQIRADLKRMQREAEPGLAVRPWWRGPLGVVLAVAAMIAIVALWLPLRAPLPPPRIVRTTKLTSDRMEKGDAFASDGIRLFFTEKLRGHWSLVVMPIKGGEVVPVPTPFKDVSLLAGSPDGSELLLAESQKWSYGPLWVMPSGGGAPRRLGDAVGWHGSWSPDGMRIAWGNGPDVYVMNSNGTGSRKLVSGGGAKELVVAHVTWSPDSKLLRFEYGSGGGVGM